MDQENQHVRFTRAAKRRAEAAAASEAAEDDQSAAKKRVVLGELTNVLQNDAVGAASKAKAGSEAETVKPQSKKKKKSSSKAKNASLPIAKPATINTTASETTKKKSSDEEIGEKLEDPQMCVPYVSDVYEYLHQLEVTMSMNSSSLISFCVVVELLFLGFFFFFFSSLGIGVRNGCGLDF